MRQRVASNDAPADGSDGSAPIVTAIEHLEAALVLLDRDGRIPALGARVEECLHALREFVAQ